MFNDGAHDRVFTGMLNGAVVVSEYSSYLEELFEDQHDLFMFDWQHTKEQMEVIHQLLSAESYRADIARNAYGKVINNQTWENRAERIIEAVDIFRQ
ncbi:MAG: glycosyltransferase family 1 protein, partial [Schwartzia sp.]|nr:glycosyltransferase family 1 protein [Schwartzia sp. (in: firmicutes)]